MFRVESETPPAITGGASGYRLSSAASIGSSRANPTCLDQSKSTFRFLADGSETPGLWTVSVSAHRGEHHSAHRGCETPERGAGPYSGPQSLACHVACCYVRRGPEYRAVPGRYEAGQGSAVSGGGTLLSHHPQPKPER